MNKNTINIKRWALKASVILCLAGGNANAVTIETGILYSDPAARQAGGARALKATLGRYWRHARAACRRSGTSVTLRNRYHNRTRYSKPTNENIIRTILSVRFSSRDTGPISDLRRQFERRKVDMVAIALAATREDPQSGVSYEGRPYVLINTRVINLIPMILAHEWGHSMLARHDQAFRRGSRSTVMSGGQIRFYSHATIKERGERIGDNRRYNARLIRNNRMKTSQNNGDFFIRNRN